MVQKGVEKQEPLDQRGRGKNPEHQEGKDNLRNQQEQKPPAPAPKKRNP